MSISANEIKIPNTERVIANKYIKTESGKMKTIAIVGAGPGLGLSIAERFGKNGFQVALIALLHFIKSCEGKPVIQLRGSPKTSRIWQRSLRSWPGLRLPSFSCLIV